MEMQLVRLCKKFYSWSWAAAIAATIAAALMASQSAAKAQDAPEFDTALVLSVDVSDSVDSNRYRLQIEGIARALEDESVVATITSGPKGGILLSLVLWADRAQVALDWQPIRSANDALRVAGLIRALPQMTGEFTCVSHMFEYIKENVITRVPPAVARTVVDVSGDGIDNCAPRDETKRQRDALLKRRVTINGLPILVAGENDVVGSGAYRAPGWNIGTDPLGPAVQQTTLQEWYREYVVGGPGNFLLPANGFEDFGRAFRQKFVIEVSGTAPLPAMIHERTSKSEAKQLPKS